MLRGDARRGCLVVGGMGAVVGVVGGMKAVVGGTGDKSAVVVAGSKTEAGKCDAAEAEGGFELKLWERRRGCGGVEGGTARGAAAEKGVKRWQMHGYSVNNIREQTS